MRTRADKLSRIDLPDGPVWVDEYGYLTDPDLWSRDFAHHTAQILGIDLTPAHWDIIAIIRAYKQDHGVAADVRHVLAHLGAQGMGKKDAKALLFDLFPTYAGHACKIAGMQQPRAWSTG